MKSGLRWMACLVLVVGCKGKSSSDAGSSGNTTPDAAMAPSDAGVPDATVAGDAGSRDAAMAPDAGRVGTLADLYDGYCTRAATLWCASVADCACIEPEGAPLTPAACEPIVLARCRSALADIGARVTAGQLIVLPDNVDACLAASARSMGRCEPPRRAAVEVVCAAMTVVNVALGASCTEGICARGAGLCTGGTCVAFPTAGQPCENWCAPGARCVRDPAMDGAVSTATCVAQGTVGGACTEDDDCADALRCLGGSCTALTPAGSACTSETTCAAGLTCTGGFCAAPSACAMNELACANQATCAVPQVRRCAARNGPDGGCTQDGDCSAGLFCDSTAGACANLPVEGQPCANGAGCADGLGCTPDTLCGALPSDGGMCALGPNGPFLCAPGLFCHDDGTCGGAPMAGDPCAIPNLCPDGLACDFTATGSICVTPKPAGGECQNDQVCAAGNFCDYRSNTCAPSLADGAPCPTGNECGPGLACLLDVPGNPHCRPMPTSGQACLFDCAEGLYCASTPGTGACLAPICRAVLGG